MTAKEFRIQYALGTLSDVQKLSTARNYRTSRQVLTLLADDPDCNIRRNVWNNCNTPIPVIRKIWRRASKRGWI